MFQFLKRKEHKAIVLMYHRINKAVSDTWQLCVSPECFQQQLSILHDYNVTSMKEVVENIHTKKIAEATVVITFDDGYLDNYTTAVPLLQQYNFPATFFLTNNFDNTNKEFWWDALEYILLENESLPNEIQITIKEEIFLYRFDEPWQKIIKEEDMKEVASWLPWITPPSAKHALFVHLSEVIKALDEEEKKNVLTQLFAIAQQNFFVRSEYKVMSETNAKEINDNVLFEAGCHSAHHIALAKFDAHKQKENIMDNKFFLEKLLGNEIKGYGYAHGSFNNDSINILRQNGFNYACCTEEKTVTNNSNVFCLPRFQVKNWNKEEFKNQVERMFNS